MAGAFPEGFYSTTNQRTEIRLAGKWVPVGRSGDGLRHRGRREGAARCVPMNEIRLGEPIVVGHAGVRVFPEERSRDPQTFGSWTAASRPKSPREWPSGEIARELCRKPRRRRQDVVRGRAGRRPYRQRRVRLQQMIRWATSTSCSPATPWPPTTSSSRCSAPAWASTSTTESWPRPATNTICGRSIASAAPAASVGRRKRRALLGHHVRVRTPWRRFPAGRQHPRRRAAARRDYRRAGRPKQMRAKIRGVTFCLMIATTLHSIAVGNLLPAWIKVVCVDINPSTVIKLADRGSFQTVGLVTDVEPFLRALVQELVAWNRDRAGESVDMTRAARRFSCARPITTASNMRSIPGCSATGRAERQLAMRQWQDLRRCWNKRARRSTACRRWPVCRIWCLRPMRRWSAAKPPYFPIFVIPSGKAKRCLASNGSPGMASRWSGSRPGVL